MSPWPWHLSIAFLANFLQDPSCDSLVSSQHFPPWFPIRQAEDAAFNKERKKKKTKPTRKAESDDLNWTLNQNYTINFLCVFWLRKKAVLQFSVFHLPGSSTVLCSTGKCHYKMPPFKIIFFTRCNHFPVSWMMMAWEATDIFHCWLWDLVWCLNRYIKQTNRNNTVQVSGFILFLRRC